jgi:hypothetical protein
MPTVDLTNNELAAVTAAIKRAIEEDRFPRAPRLDPLRPTLATLEQAAASIGSPAAKSAEPAPQDPKKPPAGLLKAARIALSRPSSPVKR